MARWILTFVVIIFVKKVHVTEETTECKSIKNKIGSGDHLICTNVTSYFFRKFEIPSNKISWLTCENCTLTTIDENTFPYQNNHIHTLSIVRSKVKVLKKLAFSRYPFLKILLLRNNSIDNVDTKSLANMKKLTQLDLSQNNIKIVINNMFSDLKNLDILDLNKNNLFYIQPEGFNGLTNLKYLYLNDNYLNKLEEQIFKHLINLKILHIQNNNLLEIHPLAFMNLKNLNFLYLNNNSISYLAQYNFQPLTSLIDLQLRFNRLKEIETSSFNGLKSLRNLLLRDNELTTIKPYGFVGLNSLEVLDLTNNSFEDFNLDIVIKNINKLYMLWLGKNSINNFTLDYKSDVQNSLKYIDLSYNNLTFVNYKLFYNKFPSVKELYVFNNYFDCDIMMDMYNFFDSNDVTLCLMEDCKENSTMNFITEICNSETTETSYTFPSDFTTKDSSINVKFDMSIMILALLGLVSLQLA
ncbi:insulin-like growth factor-binding protein complex acid labile subunit [Coccinella septempunctata]|uniref:insulin-like growth factor-binding protein complex acid labile subunit n=1 Tax=Coccinella septempunctata TaxID=41139 RepID=UPI001D070E8D|nr:insulin-like growth factor-binding protein complex acid labile subunit [Coccinella septempunctata]XP_044755309.1 insulin-like growth factor-binding protein complex acid labile subunit [Coccinella septempunctata]XP_044755310.1 insulin-like growth factor-binding protein complex acid labile subunit [Coccinella septempunctata]